jgi:hypothetical protein
MLPGLFSLVFILFYFFIFYYLRLGHGYQAYFKVKKDWAGTKPILKSTYKLPKPILKFIVATSKLTQRDILKFIVATSKLMS